jgi:hypothetical protein
MLLGAAKETARRWVEEEGRSLAGFYGAFFHGSVNELPDGALLPATSDLDVMVVLSGPAPAATFGKFRYQDVLLEVSFLPAEQVRSAEQVLSAYHLAGSFRVPSVILDPSGHLTGLQTTVAREYARLPWVHRRCEQARGNVLRFLEGLQPGIPFHEQVSAWLFAAGATTHVLLVAGLRNPTVRRRYEAARELLEEYGRLDFHETLLELLGSARMTRQQAEQHLEALTEAYDAASTVLKTPYRFAADLTPESRPIAIEGSRESIDSARHREAVFWMVAAYSRCQWVLAHDAPPEMQARHDAGYRRLLADLGIVSFQGLQERGEQVSVALPQVWQMAEVILAANPGVEP